jgi:hypothetical protein
MADEGRQERSIFEGEVQACLHNVSFYYDDFSAELTEELKELLTEEAEQRATKLIVEGYHSGELNCLYTSDDGSQEEIRGYWEIRG